MDLAEVSTIKLKEISQNYQLKIDTLKREMDEYRRKNSVIEEEIEKRQKIEEFKRKVEEESKEKIQKIMKGDASSSDESKEKKPVKKIEKKVEKKIEKKVEKKKDTDSGANSGENDESSDSKTEQEKKWTIDDMKKLLDKKGVKYTTNLKKAEFIKLIRENNGVREMNALYKEK
jgi:uncharacterized membrane protein YheB (UPF0754 family)